jgi:N-acetylglutamate synthase-like GNAT family acetyltransferase
MLPSSAGNGTSGLGTRVDRDFRESDASPLSSPKSAEPCSVRTFTQSDAAIVGRLAREGLLPGLAGHYSHQTELIPQAYLAPGREHFWVAEAGDNVVGTVALAEVSPDVGCLQWLRVAPPCQADSLVARRLVQAATAHARAMGLLKLIIEAPAALQPQIVSFFHLLGFEFSRSREVGGTNVLEFYLNLYERPQLRSE